MHTPEAQSCKTCEASVAGMYCSQCGQKVILHRITVRHLLSDFFKQITNLDRGLWHTAVVLFRNPGKVVRDYACGRTVEYATPFRYVLIWVTLSFLLYFSLWKPEAQVAEMQAMMGAEMPTYQGFMEQWNKIVQDYSQLLALLLVPTNALCSWLLFRKKGLNYAEHLVGNAYFYGQVMVVSVLITPVLAFVARDFTVAFLSSLGITFIYYVFAFRSLFSLRWFHTLFHSTLVVVFGYLLYTLVIGLAGGIVGIIWAMNNKF